MTAYVVVWVMFREDKDVPYKDVQYATDSKEDLDNWLELSAHARKKYLNLDPLPVIYDLEESEAQLYQQKTEHYLIKEFSND